MHRSGLADSCQCYCGLGVEDAFHFFKCPAHFANRPRLFGKIQEILSDDVKPYAAPMSVISVLSPGRYDNFTLERREAILNATFE